jgi:hypothetical protein
MNQKLALYFLIRRYLVPIEEHIVFYLKANPPLTSSTPAELGLVKNLGPLAVVTIGKNPPKSELTGKHV